MRIAGARTPRSNASIIVPRLVGRGRDGARFTQRTTRSLPKIASRLLRGFPFPGRIRQHLPTSRPTDSARRSHRQVCPPHRVVVYDVGTFERARVFIFIGWSSYAGHTLGYWLRPSPAPGRDSRSVHGRGARPDGGARKDWCTATFQTRERHGRASTVSARQWTRPCVACLNRSPRQERHRTAVAVWSGGGNRRQLRFRFAPSGSWRPLKVAPPYTAPRRARHKLKWSCAPMTSSRNCRAIIYAGVPSPFPSPLRAWVRC